jgi:hypothetical protein
MNRKHMIDDHHGRTAGEQLCWPEPWTRFSARTSHHAALRQLASRVAGILHGCLKTGTPYDEVTAWQHRLVDAP